MTILIIGAGAAGLIAAWRAGSMGARVVLLEKEERPGTKILISGGGKCNLTHDGGVEELLAGFSRLEARFLRPSLYRFPPSEIMRMVSSRGLNLFTRPDGRVFPSEGNAKDVVAILREYAESVGVQIRLRSVVTGLERDEHVIRGVQMGEVSIKADRVILCVGGCSYPGSGTTGDGWPWVQQLGHTIQRIHAALAPIFLTPVPPDGWSGIALRDVILRARRDNREVAKERGDVLFTHKGISGPATLEISRAVAKERRLGPVSMEIDIHPDDPFEVVSRRMEEWAKNHPLRQISAFVAEKVPARLADVLTESAGAQNTKGAYLSRPMRNRLTGALKGWSPGDVINVPLEKGEVTAGGVCLDEVNPDTMESRLIKGLYLCGEILDVAGRVGGYNLQAAFSTGYVAGDSAARR